jgi:hypothetical protein
MLSFRFTHLRAALEPELLVCDTWTVVVVDAGAAEGAVEAGGAGESES